VPSLLDPLLESSSIDTLGVFLLDPLLKSSESVSQSVGRSGSRVWDHCLPCYIDSYHQGMVRPRVADGGDGFQT
jgi:hypothetical protein